jgi:DNA modification methylase
MEQDEHRKEGCLTSEVFREQSGENRRENESVVSEEQAPRVSARKGGRSKKEIRNDAISVSGNADEAKREVPDLRDRPDDAEDDGANRSLPQDREGSRDSVLPLQHGAGAVLGQSKASTGGGGVSEWQPVPDNSVDCIITSIPFGTQYEYSPSFNDLGHNANNGEFFEQMGFLTPNLLRVLKPGRVACIHVKDRIRFGNVTGDGFPTVEPFSDHTVKAFTDAGFRLIARITIDTDVVRENNQTYRLGWSENAKDSSKMGAGMPEYVLCFRKLPSDQSNGYADLPVQKSKADIAKYRCVNCNFTTRDFAQFDAGQSKLKSEGDEHHQLFRCPKCKCRDAPEKNVDVSGYTRADWQIDAAGFWRDSGDRLPDPETMKHIPLPELGRMWKRYCLAGGYDHTEHVALAKALENLGKLPSSFMLFPPVSRNMDVWSDIIRMDTLNKNQSSRNMEMHVCPLQLGIIKRLITRYTNPGEIVLDPFAGIYSVPQMAVRMGRIGWGYELSGDYWKDGIHYCECAESDITVPTLFDLAELSGEPESAEEVAL